MIISRTTNHTIKQFLPHTAAELAQIVKASRSTVKDGGFSEEILPNRYPAAFAGPVQAYASTGKTVRPRHQAIGSRVDIRA